MNQFNETEQTQVISKKISGQQRSAALNKHFPKNVALLFEQSCFAFMSRFVSDYRGGYWDFFEVSNGAFYMALGQTKDQSVEIDVPFNEFRGKLSSEAAGIVVSLYAISHLMNKEFSEEIVENLVGHYYALRDFAGTHAEKALILKAID